MDYYIKNNNQYLQYDLSKISRFLKPEAELSISEFEYNEILEQQNGKILLDNFLIINNKINKNKYFPDDKNIINVYVCLKFNYGFFAKSVIDMIELNPKTKIICSKESYENIKEINVEIKIDKRLSPHLIYIVDEYGNKNCFIDVSLIKMKEKKEKMNYA